MRARASRAAATRSCSRAWALKGELDQVATDLENQYHVVYARPASLVPPEKTEVSVKQPGLTVRGTPAPVRKSASRERDDAARFVFWPGVLLLAGWLAWPATVARQWPAAAMPPSGARVPPAPQPAPAPLHQRHRRKARRSSRLLSGPRSARASSSCR